MKRLLMLLTLAHAPAILAHGEEAHPAPAFDASQAEQMPFGIAADPRKAKRTIDVAMSEMRFAPAELQVRRGETVKFILANKGKLLHEMVLGRMNDLRQHAEMMRKHPQMEHDEPHMVHVQPGKTGTMGWRFTEPGTFYYACLIPGHFEAGMIGKITVIQ